MNRKHAMRILCLALVTVLLFVFSGCTRNSEEPAPTQDAQTSAAISTDESDEGDDIVSTGKIWDFLDQDVAAFAKEYDINNIEGLRLNVLDENKSIYSTSDAELIDKIFQAMDQISATEETVASVPNSDQTFTFILSDGSEFAIKFNDNNLVGTDGAHLLMDDANLWDAAIELRENASESYTSDIEQTDEETSDQPKKIDAGVSHFSYEEEPTGDGTEYIFGNALVITIPADWSGKYTMEKGDDYVTFYHKDSHEQWQAADGSDGGVLFGIYYSADNNDSEDSDLGLAKDGGHYYMSYPSELQAWPDDEDIVNEYIEMVDEVGAIESNAFSTITE